MILCTWGFCLHDCPHCKRTEYVSLAALRQYSRIAGPVPAMFAPTRVGTANAEPLSRVSAFAAFSNSPGEMKC